MTRRNGQWLDVSPGAMSARHRNALLSSIPPEPESVARAQDTFSSLFQETKRQEGSLLIYRLDRLEGNSEPFVAYRPENLIIRAFHDGVTPATFGSFSEGAHHSTYRWTFPDLGTPIAITVDNPDPDVGPVFDDVFVTPGQTGAVLELQCEVGTRPQGSGEVFTVVGQFLLNGQPVLNLDTTGGTVQRDASGAVTNQAFLPIVPIFEHPASGSFHLSADRDGQSILDEAYIQRGLEWAQPWPNLENMPLDQPVEFSNQLQWDGGEPLNDQDGPRWHATVAGINYPPDTPDGMPQYNYGSQVSFRFNPDEPQVTARARASGSRTLTLLPEDSNAEYPSLEAWRQARQAREDCPAVAYYSVEGQAITYDAPPALYTTTETFTEKVVARVRKLFVTGTRFEPNPIVYDPGQAQPVVLKAEVASCLFVEPQIRWSVTVRGERPVDPEDPGQGLEGYDAFVVPAQDWQDFTQDFTLEVPWNGQGPDGRPLPTGTYHAELLVEVREKNRVDPDGNVIMKSATGTADLEVQGGPRIDITDFTATPSSFPAQTGQTVTFDAHATVSGFTLDEPPTVRWTWRVRDPGGNVLFESSQEGVYLLSFHEAPGLPPLAAGIYPAEVEVVATDPNDPSRFASDTAGLDLQVGQAQTRRVEVSNFRFVLPPGQEALDVENVENGGIGFFEADLTATGFSNSSPQVHWTLTFLKDGTRVGQVQGVQAPGPWTFPWDGSVEEGIKLGEGQVEATLEAFACEDDRLADAHVSDGTALGPLCGESTLRSTGAALTGQPIRVVKVRFGGNPDLKHAADVGPFPVYDYLNKTARGKKVKDDGSEIAPSTQPHWDRADSSSFPALFVQQRLFYLSADLKSELSVPRRVRVTVSGQFEDGTFFAPPPVTTTIDDWAANDIGPTLLFPGRTPGGVGRHLLRLNWTIEVLNEQGRSVASYQMFTPKDTRPRTAHMLYTVLQFLPEQPDDPSYDAITADPADARYPWYHSKTFENTGVSGSVPGKRSPLDMATGWAQGSASEADILRSLTQKLHDDSGLRYDPNVDMVKAFGPLSNFQNLWPPRRVLDKEQVDCAGSANLLKILSDTCGVRTRTLRVQNLDLKPGADASLKDRTTLFTRYADGMGSGRQSVMWILGPNFSFNHRIGVEFHPYVQYVFSYHQFLERDGVIYDATCAFDPNVNRAEDDDINPNTIFNQWNVRKPADHLPGGTQSAPDYAAYFHPGRATEFGIPESTYMKRLIYLWNAFTKQQATEFKSQPLREFRVRNTTIQNP